MKNILITGGAGFLGSHLISRIVGEPETNIICVDNFLTSDFYNIEGFIRNLNFEFLKHDLTNPLNLFTFPELAKFKLKIYGIEEIYHFACPASPKDYDQFPLQTCLANSHATKNALDIAREFKSKFLFASSSAVYGKVPENLQPVKENHPATIDTLGVHACFVDGKRFAENLVIYAGAEFNFPTKIVRIFTSYGPNMRLADGRTIPYFVSSALDNAEITIFGGEKATSSLCYVSDIIDGLQKMMASDESGPFNMGGERVHQLKDIAQMIVTVTGSHSRITYSDSLPSEGVEPLGDITLIKEKLGWLPVTPLEKGLEKTVKAMEANKIVKFKPDNGFI